MGKTHIQELCVFGQSVWLDNISRSMIKSGKLKEMIGVGLRGMTFNPTIFDKAISSGSDTKNPGYSDIKYVTELIVRDTVNTMPEQTFNAFLDHGEVKESLIQDVNAAIKVIGNLKKIGIDINEVCAQLLKDGVAAFERSFESLLNSIEKKKVCLMQKLIKLANKPLSG